MNGEISGREIWSHFRHVKFEMPVRCLRRDVRSWIKESRIQRNSGWEHKIGRRELIGI